MPGRGEGTEHIAKLAGRAVAEDTSATVTVPPQHRITDLNRTPAGERPTPAPLTAA